MQMVVNAVCIIMLSNWQISGLLVKVVLPQGKPRWWCYVMAYSNLTIDQE